MDQVPVPLALEGVRIVGDGRAVAAAEADLVGPARSHREQAERAAQHRRAGAAGGGSPRDRGHAAAVGELHVALDLRRRGHTVAGASPGAAGVVGRAAAAVVAGRAVGLRRIRAGARPRIARTGVMAGIERRAHHGASGLAGPGLARVAGGAPVGVVAGDCRSAPPGSSRRPSRDCRSRRRGTSPAARTPPGSARARPALAGVGGRAGAAVVAAGPVRLGRGSSRRPSRDCRSRRRGRRRSRRRPPGSIPRRPPPGSVGGGAAVAVAARRPVGRGGTGLGRRPWRT